MRCKEDTGRFTLVEMLVVISIICIIAALLLPALQNSIDMAYATSCINNGKNLGMASAMYSDDFDGYVVPTFSPNGEKGGTSLDNFTGKLQIYLGRSRKTPYVSAADLPIAACPALPQRMWGYGHNWTYLSHCKQSRPDLTKWVRTSQATNPQRTVVFCDNVTTSGGWRAYVRPAGQPPVTQDVVPDFRHPADSLSTVWLDSHVESRNVWDTFFTPGISDNSADKQWWALKKR